MLGLSYILQIRGLTLVDAGKIVGVSKQAVYKWIVGDNKLPSEKLDILHESFQMDKNFITEELDDALKAKILYREIELITMGNR